MKPELHYLVWTALLTGCLWIPVVIGFVRARGALKPEDYVVAPTSPLPAWVNRANRAPVNAVESLLPFATVVLIAQAAGVSTPITVNAAATYFFARLARAVVHIAGVAVLRARTMLFTIGWAAFAAIAIELLRKG